MSSLAECPGCQRHLRVTESKCPFCGIETTLAAPTFTTTAGRLSRAALLVALTACEGSQTRDVYGGPPHAAVYGGPPVSGDASSALEDFLRDAGIDGSTIDAGATDASTKDAAAPTPTTIQRTIYGGPPVPQPKIDPPKK